MWESIKKCFFVGLALLILIVLSPFVLFLALAFKLGLIELSDKENNTCLDDDFDND